MDTHTTPRAASIATITAMVLATVFATTATAQTRSGGGRQTPDSPFGEVWVLDRMMPEHVLWQTLVGVTSTEGFQPVVIHGGEDSRWTESLEHLLRIVPQGDSIWVSDEGVLFDVDRVATPAEIAASDPSEGPVIWSAAAGLDPVAALIAMRLDGVLTVDPADQTRADIIVGQTSPRRAMDQSQQWLADRTEAIDFANSLAGSRVVMVARAGLLPPELVLWAFQREALVLEVAYPGKFSIYNPAEEIAAVEEIRRQIHTALPGLVGRGAPEALVIAAGWHEIPFRFPRDLSASCSDCDNGVYESAADSEYANLDGDPWGEPDVPVGRLMSPVPDLLAIQSVVGVWREHDAFAMATDGLIVDLIGGRPEIRDGIAAGWQSAYPEQVFSVMGPDDIDPGYRLDREEFFRISDRSDVVMISGHGHPDALSPDGGPFNLALTGGQLVGRDQSGRPSFWFLHACSTGKPDMADHRADETLLVGLQSRLALGSLMAVEIVAAGSADPWWWTTVLAPDLTVGELVRRFNAAGIEAYRDGGEAPPGMAQPGGNEAGNRANASTVLFWIGDPLTRVSSR